MHCPGQAVQAPHDLYPAAAWSDNALDAVLGTDSAAEDGGLSAVGTRNQLERMPPKGREITVPSGQHASRPPTRGTSDH
jgi:hypothetical protein